MCIRDRLYGAEIWADVLKLEKYRRLLSPVQRSGALTVASSYRTVSESAALLVAGIILVDLLAHKRQLVYKRKYHV